jgi:hypothetical protein
MLKYIPSIPSFFSTFIMKWWFILSKIFLVIYWNHHVIFVLYSVYVLYYIYWFTYVEPFLHPWNEIRVIISYDLFNVFLNLVCKYFIENFYIYVYQGTWAVNFLLLWPYTVCIS